MFPVNNVKPVPYRKRIKCKNTPGQNYKLAQLSGGNLALCFKNL